MPGDLRRLGRLARPASTGVEALATESAAPRRSTPARRRTARARRARREFASAGRVRRIAPWLARAARAGETSDDGRPSAPRPSARPRRALGRMLDRRALAADLERRGRSRSDARAGRAGRGCRRPARISRRRPRTRGRLLAPAASGSPSGPTALAEAMDFRSLYKPDRHLFAIGYNLGAGPARRRLLRPARLRVVPDQLPGGRPGRGAPPALVPARPALHPRRRPDRPDLVGRHDVRVPDAPAAAAQPARARCSTEACRDRRGPADRVRPAERRPLGDLRVGLQRRSTPTATTSTSRSACPGLGLKRGLERDLVIAPYATALATMIRPREALRELPPAGRRGGRGAVRLLRGDRLHAATGSPRASARSSSGRTWPTTRG